MTTADFTREANERLKRVPEDQYERFLSQLDGMIDRPRGTSLKELRRFAGSISDETAEQMLRIIEEECERIDYDSWELPPGHEHRDQPPPE